MTSYFGRATESVRNSTTLPLMLRLIGCSYVVGKYVAHFTMCEGPSMLPTVSVRGDILLHESVSYRTRRPLQVGDVVICKANDRPERQVVKRIVGLGGDVVYVPAALSTSRRSYRIVVPPGRMWLEGDNGANSNDSRHYGPVPLGMVLGRVVCRVWPLPKFGSLPEVAGGARIVSSRAAE